MTTTTHYNTYLVTAQRNDNTAYSIKAVHRDDVIQWVENHLDLSKNWSVSYENTEIIPICIASDRSN